MKRIVATAIVFGAVAFWAVAQSQTGRAADEPVKVEPPANRVVVMYFHRTQRCPTCLRMGSYSEEAVVKGFADQIKDGTVEFHYVDFQDEQNAGLTKAYKVGGPTLVVARVIDNKVKSFKNLTEIWAKNRDKDVFLKYVRDKVVACQKPDTKTGTPTEAEEAGSEVQ